MDLFVFVSGWDGCGPSRDLIFVGTRDNAQTCHLSEKVQNLLTFNPVSHSAIEGRNAGGRFTLIF